MSKLKNLLSVLFAPAFIVFIGWILSTYNEFNWSKIIFVVFCVLGFQICLWIRNPQKLLEPVPGFMMSGSVYAFMGAEDRCGEYIELLGLFATVIFVFTIFFICLPNIYPKKKKS